MAGLKWTLKAVGDLELIYDYIAADSPWYARIQVERLYKSVEHLRTFPEAGRHLPEFPQRPHREVINGAYRCIYRYEEQSDTVFVITVVHGSRLLTAQLLDPPT
ncbi:MAG: type II toxin-antitoxin system RelE/ParE family toxin [Deltaproteobacteria bacterium HGW-Deltaproteobacteria-4]|nr:MAG: type II toxin-antitoxin system RelE/ParE family toxin [Deltaproteobacteria bacterium HGW-Deltaproteobacteria-4]